jgi:hypothetical protein
LLHRQPDRPVADRLHGSEEFADPPLSGCEASNQDVPEERGKYAAAPDRLIGANQLRFSAALYYYF